MSCRLCSVLGDLGAMSRHRTFGSAHQTRNPTWLRAAFPQKTTRYLCLINPKDSYRLLVIQHTIICVIQWVTSLLCRVRKGFIEDTIYTKPWRICRCVGFSWINNKEQMLPANCPEVWGSIASSRDLRNTKVRVTGVKGGSEARWGGKATSGSEVCSCKGLFHLFHGRKGAGDWVGTVTWQRCL